LPVDFALLDWFAVPCSWDDCTVLVGGTQGVRRQKTEESWLSGSDD